MLGDFIAGWICGEHFNWRQACGAVLAQKASLSLNSFFFFLVWAQRPPHRRKCRGVIFQEKKIQVFVKRS